MREKADLRRIIRQMMLQRLTKNGRHQNSAEQQEPIVFSVTHDSPPVIRLSLSALPDIPHMSKDWHKGYYNHV
jgi:hypothetical protein